MILDMSCGIAVYKACAEILLNELAMNAFVSSWHLSKKAAKKRKVRNSATVVVQMAQLLGGLTRNLFAFREPRGTDCFPCLGGSEVGLDGRKIEPKRKQTRQCLINMFDVKCYSLSIVLDG